MAIGTGDAQQRRGRRDRYVEPHTRPAHIADKRGNVEFKDLVVKTKILIRYNLMGLRLQQ